MLYLMAQTKNPTHVHVQAAAAVEEVGCGRCRFNATTVHDCVEMNMYMCALCSAPVPRAEIVAWSSQGSTDRRLPPDQLLPRVPWCMAGVWPQAVERNHRHLHGDMEEFCLAAVEEPQLQPTGTATAIPGKGGHWWRRLTAYMHGIWTTVDKQQHLWWSNTGFCNCWIGTVCGVWCWC